VRRAAVSVFLAAPAVALGATRAVEAAQYGWSYARLMHRIDQVEVRLGARRYKIDSDLVVCNGVGHPVATRPERRWRRFTCTQAVFRNGTMLDLTFDVRVLDEKRFRLANVRSGP
jgi:hypothetical protein